MSDVHFLGFVDQSEIAVVYAAGDVFILPSHRDPRGTVVNEAMAAGLPVIVTSGTGVCGPGYVVQHDREGLVFPAGNLAAMGDACLYLTDPRTRTEMADAESARRENPARISDRRSALKGLPDARNPDNLRRSGTVRYERPTSLDLSEDQIFFSLLDSGCAVLE